MADQTYSKSRGRRSIIAGCLHSLSACSNTEEVHYCRELTLYVKSPSRWVTGVEAWTSPACGRWGSHLTLATAKMMTEFSNTAFCLFRLHFSKQFSHHSSESKVHFLTPTLSYITINVESWKLFVRFWGCFFSQIQCLNQHWLVLKLQRRLKNWTSMVVILPVQSSSVNEERAASFTRKE